MVFSIYSQSRDHYYRLTPPKGTFLSSQGKPCPTRSHPPAPPAPGNHSCVVSVDLPIQTFHINGVAHQWLFVTVFFHFASCLGSPKLQPGSECHSCSWLSNVPLCVWATSSLPNRLRVGIWVASALGSRTLMHECVCTHTLLLLFGTSLEGEAAVLYGSFVFEDLPDSFYGGCTISRSISAVNEGPSFSTSSSTLVTVCLLWDYSCPGRREGLPFHLSVPILVGCPETRSRSPLGGAHPL